LRHNDLMRFQAAGSRSVFAVVLATVLFAISRCGNVPESIFQLAPESRLPRWFTLPRNVSRSDVTVTLAYYIQWRRVAVFTLWDAHGTKLDEIEGRQRGLEPIQSLQARCSDRRRERRAGESNPCADYEVITARGVTEIIEHKIFGPVFHISDDPAIRKWLIPDDVERREDGAGSGRR